ncbi:MAG: ParB N-terminal domain-containing protein [Candidatus Bathyarchaeota archaeon]|nr:MAG: ParB N-terminal domain-containing protein [Candidatus Bathyarchaeota archaeon]
MHTVENGWSGTKLGLKPIKLGKKMELKYISFSELIIPWEICVDSNGEAGHNDYNGKQLSALTYGPMSPTSTKALKTLKQADLEALKASIGQFGLLKPFEVAELPEQLDYFYGKGKYVIIDGQRRYFAIRELLRLPSEHDEKKEKNSLNTRLGYDQIEKLEIQAQEQFEKLSIRDYVLVPCLIYPYKTYLQMMRHSTEDSRFSVKPSKIFLQIVEKMRQQGIVDLHPDDLGNLWETRKIIEGERLSIEKTLEEIRSRSHV